MELLLNLMWLALSVSLGLLLLVSGRRREAVWRKHSYSRSTVWMTYVILIALLLPAISMTDDLIAMAAPSDSEQIARRYDNPMAGHQHLTVPVAIFHGERDHSASPLVCFDRVQAVPSAPAITAPPAEHPRGRAPPTALS